MRQALAASVVAAVIAASCGAPGPTAKPAGSSADASAEEFRTPSATPAPASPEPPQPSAPPSPTSLLTPSVHPSPVATQSPVAPGAGAATLSPPASPFAAPTATPHLAPVSGRWTRLQDLPTMPELLSGSLPVVALGDGRVVAIQDDVCGGWSMVHGPPDDPLPPAILDPNTGRWATGDPLGAFRAEIGVVALRDGRVLLAGGANGWWRGYSGSKLFDPDARRWSNDGLLATPRSNPAAARLPDGRVLVAGGTYFRGFSGEADAMSPSGRPAPAPLASAEIYDPATGRWTPTGSLLDPIAAADAWSLPDGRVLVVGREQALGDEPAEVYDPAAGTWARAGAVARQPGSATALLPDGSLLVAGGALPERGWRPTDRVLRLDPAAGTVTDLARLPGPRVGAVAVPLADGRILVVGGTGGPTVAAFVDKAPLASALVYDPASDAWTTTAPMPFADFPASATLLGDGSVVVAGGTVPFDTPMTDVCGRPSVGWTARFVLGPAPE